MAYYGIPSAGLSLTASTASDTIAMANQGSSVSAVTIFGEGGNDVITFGAVGYTAVATYSGTLAFTGGDATLSLVGQDTTYTTAIATGVLSAAVTGVITSQAAATFIRTSEIRGNAGNDSIILGENLSEISGATIGGGQGNDWMGVATFVNNQFSLTDESGGLVSLSGTIADAYFEGGDGNDTIYLYGEEVIFSALSANGNQGNDLVIVAGNGRMTGGSYIGLGQGADQFSGDISGVTTSSVVGGLGNDTINFSFISATNVFIGGDSTTDAAGSTDGADLIDLVGDGFSSGTIYGNGGNDTVFLQLSGITATTIATNAGFDVLSIDSGALKDVTVQMGNQGDIVQFTGLVNVDSSTFTLGRGLDSFYLSADVGSGAQVSNASIIGGLGNDLILASSTLSGGTTMQTVLQYADSLDSTLAAFDTIAISGTNTFSGTYVFRYDLGGATQASFSGRGATGTNGIVAFSSTVSSDVTSRVELISSNTTTGNIAVFQDGSNNTYLFIDGGAADDLVVQMGSNAIGALSAASVSVSLGKNINVLLDY